jgi:hypothetical protein
MSIVPAHQQWFKIFYLHFSFLYFSMEFVHIQHLKILQPYFL